MNISLNEDDGVITLLKTSTDKDTKLEQYSEEHHDYDVPAKITLTANTNQSYGTWLNQQLSLMKKDTPHGVS